MCILGGFVIVIVLILVVRYIYHIWKNQWNMIGSTSSFTVHFDSLMDNIVFILNWYHIPIIKFWIGNHLFVIPTQPQHIEILLKNHLEKSMIYDVWKPLFKNGLIVAPVEMWKRHRQIINQTMSQNILNSFVKIFVKHSDKLVDEFKGKCGHNQIDIFPIISKCTMNMICETTIGIKASEIDKLIEFTSQITKYIKTYFASGILLNIQKMHNLITLRIVKPWWNLNCIQNLTFTKTNILLLKNKQFIKKIIDMRKNKKSQTTSECFLNQLIDLDAKWTNDEICDEIQTMIIGGNEKTALAASYVILMLALHPEIQENVYREVDEILKNSETITYQNLTEMIYLERVIKETLRLFPIIPIIGRRLNEDIELNFEILPKGCSVLIPIVYLHRNPKFWPNPLKFDPDRFLPEEIDKCLPYTYIPFSGGPRNCPGFEYAMVSLKTLIASIIKHFKFATIQYETISDIKMEYFLMIKPKCGFNVILNKRQ